MIDRSQELSLSFLGDFSALCAQLEGYDEAVPFRDVLIWGHDYAELAKEFRIPLDEPIPERVQNVQPNLMSRMADNIGAIASIAGQLADPESTQLGALPAIVAQLEYGNKCREIRDKARAVEIAIVEVFVRPEVSE